MKFVSILFAVDAVVDVIHRRALSVGQPLSQVAASVCAAKVKDILSQHDKQLLLQPNLVVIFTI